MAPVSQRVATSKCARCRVSFKPGDRVSVAYIVSKAGYNAETKDFGSFFIDDFELVHVACADPGLDGVVLA